MSQVSKRALDPKTHKEIYAIFTQVLCDLNNPKDVEALLKDFLTPNERIMLPKRLCIAYLLIKGYDQRSIAKYINVSFSTITKVSNALSESGNGYRSILKHIKQNKTYDSKLERIERGIIEFMASVGGPSRLWKNINQALRDEDRFAKFPD